MADLERAATRDFRARVQWNEGVDEVVTDRTQLFVAEESFTCTDVLEVWFAGCHSGQFKFHKLVFVNLLRVLPDIGGGNVQDDVKVSLAQITLHWMVEQVIQSQCGILFDSDELARIGFILPPHSPQILPDSNINGLPLVPSKIQTTPNAIDTSGSVVQKLRNEPTPSLEAYPERSNAIAPLFDELKINKLWWLLEILPASNSWQDHNWVWHNKWM